MATEYTTASTATTVANALRAPSDSRPTMATTQYTNATTANATAMNTANPNAPGSIPWITRSALCGVFMNATAAITPTAKMTRGKSVQRSIRRKVSAEKRVVRNAMAKPMNAPEAMGAAAVKNTSGSCRYTRSIEPTSLKR